MQTQEKTPKVAVELSGVTKRFGEFVAVDDLSLDIYEGEFFSLLGPSGCGKTTTLRMIAGFEEPTEGGISVGGDPMRRGSSLQKAGKHRLPVVRHLPPPQRLRQRGLRPPSLRRKGGRAVQAGH